MWFCAGFGTCLGLVIVLAVVIDVVWKERDVTSISKRTLWAAVYRPALASLFSGLMCLIIGMLLGHLFFPQYVVP